MHSLFNFYLFFIFIYILYLVNYITNLDIWILKAAAELAWGWVRDFVTILVQTTSVLVPKQQQGSFWKKYIDDLIWWN